MSHIQEYLRPTEVIDYNDPSISAKAKELAEGKEDTLWIAGRCFEWVRDHIRHSMDYEMNPVTRRASDVLREGTGLCFAKSHLLAALLRANSIPAGFCYQRLCKNDKGPPFCLHGLNAVYLPEVGWYRIDARGNKQGVEATFSPPTERLAFTVSIEGEADLPEIWPEPLPQVVRTLKSAADFREVAENLPDIEIVSGR